MKNTKIGKQRRIHLSRETLRVLADGDMRNVAAAMGEYSKHYITYCPRECTGTSGATNSAEQCCA
jgi:hypothetical protein